jgi:hypothetical protein
MEESVAIRDLTGYLAESSMAGDPLNGGGFVYCNSKDAAIYFLSSSFLTARPSFSMTYGFLT